MQHDTNLDFTGLIKLEPIFFSLNLTKLKHTVVET